MSYGDKGKRIVFYETDKRHAELKIKLHYDGLKQGQFFRTLIEGYLSDNEDILNFISEQKEKNSIQSARQSGSYQKRKHLNFPSTKKKLRIFLTYWKRRADYERVCKTVHEARGVVSKRGLSSVA